jgi:hypothetical protein
VKCRLVDSNERFSFVLKPQGKGFKMKSRVIFSLAAVAAIAGSVLVAEAAQKGTANNGPSAKTPVGTLLGSASLWAVINADGTIARSDGAGPATTGKLATGQYEVGFFRNITGCAYQVTIGQPGAGSASPGEVTMASRSGNINGVFVTTHDSTGALADRPYHVVVTC